MRDGKVKRPLGLVAKLDRIPPCLCRLLARKCHGQKSMSHQDIADASGLPLSTVSDISRMTSWAKLAPYKIEAFSKACGVDILRLRRVREKLKRGTWWQHMSRNREQRKLFLRLFKLAEECGRR